MYPSDDMKLLNDTAVCHYFAIHWQQMGYNVRVIHLYHTYPFYYYPLLKAANKYLASKTGMAILEHRETKEYTYIKDKIKVTRIPVCKKRPLGEFKDQVTFKAGQRIAEIIRDENFEPDFILGHFLHPSIEIVSYLKSQYPKAITTVSLHGEEKRINKAVTEALPNIDMMGYRSFPIKKAFESLYGEKPYFMCFSGVPENFITKPKFFANKAVRDFVYVGSLIERKKPISLIYALKDAMGDEEFKLTYVGTGKQEKVIVDVSKKLGIRDNVNLVGRIPRESVTEELDKADVFIMISKSETFGLVYLEAMARGCIVIASKNEGMDGIIEDGVNGFLCQAGNSTELASIIKRIRNLGVEALNELSKNAVSTAKKMTDRKMAMDYINRVSSKD